MRYGSYALPRNPAAPPLPMMPDSCSGRGSSTNGSIGSFGGSSLLTWLPAVGKSAGVRRLQLARGRHLVRRIAGEHLIDGGRVIEQAVRRVAHRADQRDLVERLRHHRHVLADLRARDLRLDRLELAANIGRRIRLRIPDVDVARPALQEDHDDVPGLAEAARAFVLLREIVRQRRLLRQEEARQMQSDQPERTDAHQLAPRGTFTHLARNALEYSA